MQAIEEIAKGLKFHSHQEDHRWNEAGHKFWRSKEEAPNPGGCSPECHCRGLGVVRYEAPRGDFRFGKLFPCPNAPLESLHQEGRYGLYWDEQRQLCWEDVLKLDETSAAQEAIQEALALGHGWVYLWGDYGLGKTLLLKVAVAERLRAGCHAVYARMVDLLDDLRTSYDDDLSMIALAKRVEHYAFLPLLAVDEIDRLNPTPWAQERLFQLIDRRYDAALAGRAVTLIASNKSPEQLDGYLGSRIRDGRFKVVRLDGDDLRPGMD